MPRPKKDLTPQVFSDDQIYNGPRNTIDPTTIICHVSKAGFTRMGRIQITLTVLPEHTEAALGLTRIQGMPLQVHVEVPKQFRKVLKETG